MAERWVTVIEASVRTGRSEQTIRRWCRDGRVSAQKSGRDWLVDAGTLPRPQRRGGVAGVPPVDVALAWEHVRNHDLKQDTWIPDCLRFEDWMADSAGVIADAEAAIAGGYVPDPLQRLRVPKGQLLTRAAAMPSLRDRIIYQAAVASFAHRADLSLSDGVLSARVNRDDAKYFLRRSSDLFGQFQDLTLDAVGRGYGFLVVTDVVAYFDSIDHRLLFSQIHSLNASERAVRLLSVQLEAWDLGGGTGIPQGPNASRVLGNLYLGPVDLAVQNSGLDVIYLRFQDDIRIAARTRADAVRASRLLETEMQRRRLIPAAAKSRIIRGDEVETLTGDPKKETVVYEVTMGGVDAPRKRLRGMLDKALAKADPNWSDIRFSLWRLSLLRDSGRLKRVLGSLDRLSQEASLVAAYVFHWLHRPHVVGALDLYLNDPDRNLSDYMPIWLLAALIEAPAVPDGIVQYVRRSYRDRNLHRDLRIMAAQVSARHGNQFDVEAIERIVRSELDPAVVRGFLVALRRVRRVPKHLLSDVARRFPELKPTVAYINSRNQLPSLIYADRRIDAPA